MIDKGYNKDYQIICACNNPKDYAKTQIQNVRFTNRIGGVRNFFRAGYVETWGRGIEKICEACKKHGVPMPEYTLHLEDIMVKFTPLGHQDILKDQNVLINVPLNVLINDPLEKEVFY